MAKVGVEKLVNNCTNGQLDWLDRQTIRLMAGIATGKLVRREVENMLNPIAKLLAGEEMDIGYIGACGG